MLRTFVALLLLTIVASIGIKLGFWQLSRAVEREDLTAIIAMGRASPPLQLKTNTSTGQLTPWRSATASGTWLHQYTLLLDNRNHNGQPGYWVATPLLLEQDNQGLVAPTQPPVALMVLRGWIPRPVRPGQTQQPIPTPAGLQTVQGELLGHVPRLIQIWSWSSNSSAQLPSIWPENTTPPVVVQNLDLDEFAKVSGLQLLPVALAASPNPDSGLLQDWPEPLLDADKNRGYALQWFGFATIAGIAWLVVLWRALKRHRQRRTDNS